MDEDLALRVAEMIDLGYPERRIARVLGVANSTAHKYASIIRSERLRHGPKVEAVEDLLRQRTPIHEAARALGCKARTAKIWYDRVAGRSVPIDDELKLELAKQTTFHRLKNKFGIEDIDDIPNLIQEVFERPVIVSMQPLPDGDTAVVLIPDRTNQFDWMDKRKNEAKFKYFVNPENNYMYVQIDPSLTDVKIYNLTDLHIGSKYCRTELLKQHIKMIEEDDNAFAFLGGDIFEHLHKTSVGQPWEQKIAPMEQVSCAARMLMPIAHKTIRYAGGNHDRDRGYRFVGADLAKSLADLLRVSYSHIETVIDLELNGHVYTALLHHGSGSGRSTDSIMKEAEKYRQNCSFFAHWHMSGHVHCAGVYSKYSGRKVLGEGVVAQEYFTVIGGSYMARTGTYAEEMKLPYTAQDLTFITFNADGQYGADRVKISPI